MIAFTDARVLVIGGLGFIGRALTNRLLALGARVTVLTPSRERHAALIGEVAAKGAVVVEGDLREPAHLTPVIVGQHVVFNLAGQSGAVRSMEDPWTDLDVNLKGTLAVLEALRERNPGAKYVCVGSRLEYGKPASVPVAEDALGEPLCLHAIHKRTIHAYLRLYQRLFGLRFAIARVTNPYGPGQPPGRTAYGVINRMIHLAIAGQPITIYGDGGQLRDYLHVADVVSALLTLAGSDAADGKAYNVGSETGISLLDVATQVIAAAGGGRIVHVEWPALAAQIETGDFIADTQRIRHELGWASTIPLGEGLIRTVAHYRTGAGL